MSNCCTSERSEDNCAVTTSDAHPASHCLDCGVEGRPIALQTILHHVKHEHLARVTGEAYRFCSDPKCAVVYFGEGGTRFTVDEVRELVSAKTTGDARPVCYCFGFKEGDVREEITREGTSKIPKQINDLVKTGMCACEVRNPAGVCCIGEVNRTVRRLSSGYHVKSEAPALTSDADCCSR